MRRITILSAIAAFAVPATAFAADPTPNPKSPAAQCRAERSPSGMGATNFKNFYGTNANKSNAFGKCVSKHARQQNANTTNAAKRCKAERADPNFAATHDGKTFAQYYGTNRNNRNAFGKCVSKKANETTAAQQQAILNAAKRCKAQKADPNFAASHGGKTFAQFYGTNRNNRNAFGKCVSKEAKKDS